jgi:hypothetical protein
MCRFYRINTTLISHTKPLQVRYVVIGKVESGLTNAKYRKSRYTEYERG